MKTTLLILVFAMFALGQKPATPVVYTCPMDSEVRSNKPGKCPKCKMDLVKEKTASAVVAETSDKVVATSGKSLNIPDVEVLDQDGNVRHFYSDLVKGKTVAVNFIF